MFSIKKNLIDRFISQTRFQSYENIDEYSANLIFSQNFYICLSVLEIALRNSIDKHLTSSISSTWYEDDFLTKDSKEKVSLAKALLKRRKENISKEKIIAELSFGFWVNLFKKPYDNKLRISDIRKIFPNLPNKNKEFINRQILFNRLNLIRIFRNRIFHHEKVLNKIEFENMYAKIHEIICYFDEELYLYTKLLEEKSHIKEKNESHTF